MLLCLVQGGLLRAQDGAHSSYSPYSVYGIGDIVKQGTAYNKSMGGVGIADRGHRYINFLNPAAVTARDTLSFMLDFGMESGNKLFAQKGLRSANNTFNISDLAFTFPIYRKSAFVFALTPYSDVGYDFSHQNIDPSYGTMKYSSTGGGGLYQLTAGAGVTLWKNLSLGAQFVYYFGTIDKKTTVNFSDESIGNISSGYKLELHAMGAKFGVQYEKQLGDMFLTAGATYKTSAKLKGTMTDYKYQIFSSVVDTLNHRIDTLSKVGKAKVAGELGFGVSLRKNEKWSVEVDYLYSNWDKTHFDKTPGLANIAEAKFSSSASHSLRAGVEYIPNRNDVRYYFRRCAYRAGVYYDKSYYQLNGSSVNAYGITLGMTFPIFRYYNGLTIGIDLGQRGKLEGMMTRERYLGVSIGFNIHDIWFVKPRYD